MPRTFGDGVIHISNIDYAVHHKCDLFESHEKIPTEIDLKIGKLIAENLIEDGSTLQMGINITKRDRKCSNRRYDPNSPPKTPRVALGNDFRPCSRFNQIWSYR